jgi:tricorn protease-like protein
MRKKFRYLAAILGILGMAAHCTAQDENYVLKREQSEVPLTSIKLSPDGTLLLAGFDNGSFRLLDPESFAVKLEVEGAHHRAVNALDMDPDMDLILSAGASSLKLWDRSGEHLLDWNAHATTIWNAEISRDGSWVISSAMNKTFLLWNLRDRVLAEKMRAHTDVAMAVCFSPDNRFIASGSNDQSIRIWDLESRQVIKMLHGPTQGIFDIKFSPDGSLLAVCSKDKSVRLYDLKEEKQLHILQGHTDMVLEAEFSPDGTYLLSASADQSIILWDVERGEKIHQFLDNEGAVTDLVFHPDGRSFYSISYGKDLTHRALDPRIFVLKYDEKSYRDALAGDPLYEPRRKGESKKDYQARQQEATLKEREIINRLYEQYLFRKAR